MPVIQPITSSSGSFPYVPNTRTLTINGVSYDLSADRSWTISTSGTGTVTSVALSATMPTGLVASISGSPITSNGTLGLTVTMQSGYAIPTTSKQTQWDSAYSFTSTFPTGTAQQLLRVNTLGTALEFFTPSYLVSTDIIATTPLVWNSGTKTMSIPVATNSANGYLSSADWLTFSSKQPAITLTTTGNSGSSTFVGATLNIPTYTLAGLGGMSNPMTSLGDMIYGNAAGAPLRVAPNTTTTKKYLTMTGDGTSGAAPTWETITGFISGSGTTNYLPKFTSSSAIGNSIIAESAGVATIYGYGQVATSQAGVGDAIFFISNNDTTAGVNRQTKIYTQNLGGGVARTIITAASNVSGTSRGQFGILDEGGNNFIMQLGTGVTSTDYTMSLYTTSGLEQIRLNTNGNTYFNGGSIGVGNNSPNHKLDISTSTKSAITGLSSAINADYVGTNANRFQTIGFSWAGSTGNSNTYWGMGFKGTNFSSGTGDVFLYSGGAQALTAKQSGQIQFNLYTSVLSFSGTIAGLLAFDSSGNIITRNNVVDLTLSTTGNSGAATYNTVTGALNIPTYTLAGLGGMSNPMTSLGDMIYGNAAGAPLRLAPNTTTTKKYLAMTGDGTSGDAPFWDTINSLTGTGTSGYITYWNGTSSVTASANLVFDATNTRFGLGISTPSVMTHFRAANGATIMRMENSDTIVSLGETIGKIEFYGNDVGAGSGVTAYIDCRATSINGDNAIDIFSGSNGNVLGGITVLPSGAVNFTPISTPATAAAGDVYYDSSTNKLRCYDGTTWNDLF